MQGTETRMGRQPACLLTDKLEKEEKGAVPRGQVSPELRVARVEIATGVTIVACQIVTGDISHL